MALKGRQCRVTGELAIWKCKVTQYAPIAATALPPPIRPIFTNYVKTTAPTCATVRKFDIDFRSKIYTLVGD